VDLTLLGSGAWQHAFVPTGQSEPEWVYKLPAAYGYILPLRPRLEHFAPASAARKAALLLLKSPDRLADASRRWGGSRNAPAGSRALAALGSGVAEVICLARDGCLAPVLRRSRRRRFDTMVQQLEFLSLHGLADVLLPYRVLPELEAVLRVDERRVDYRGPAIKQRKAEFFRGGALDFESFEWMEVVSAQHRLWRCGIAFSEINQILGPMNWGLLDGRVRLADTSNLTSDARLARRLLEPAALDAKQAVVMGRLSEPATPEVAAEYFRFVRSEINQKRFDRLWRSDLDDGRRKESRLNSATDGRLASRTSAVMNEMTR
jgi:hypothetical protein